MIAQRAQQQMQRRPHGLVKVLAVCNFLAELRKRTECMDELALSLSHLTEVCGFEFLYLQILCSLFVVRGSCVSRVSWFTSLEYD